MDTAAPRVARQRIEQSEVVTKELAGGLEVNRPASACIRKYPNAAKVQPKARRAIQFRRDGEE